MFEFYISNYYGQGHNTHWPYLSKLNENINYKLYDCLL